MEANTAIFLRSFEPVTQATVTIIAKDLHSYRKMKMDDVGMLKSYCHNLLLNQIIYSNKTIDLSRSKLAKAYGIYHILIHDCHIRNNQNEGVFSEETNVIINSLHSKEFYTLQREVIQKDVALAGVTIEVERLHKLMLLTESSNSSCSMRPVGALLHGPPGCGKSSLVKLISKTCEAVLITVEASQILQSEFGAGAETLKKIFQNAVSLTEEGRVIVFLDDIDAFCPNNPDASLGVKQITNALVAELDRIHKENVSGLLVVGATCSISSVSKSLRRPGRFDQEILMNVPTQSQRLSILKLLTQGYNLSSEVCLDSLVLRTAGFVGADLKALCEEAENHAYCTSISQEANVTIDKKDFEHALHLVKPSLRKGLDCLVDRQPVRWEDIGGLEEVKAEIKQSIEWPLLYSDALRRLDLSPTKGILLFGPPGCCKTTLIKAAATSCHVNFLSLTGAQVFSAYVGQSEKIISEAFQKARALSPAILFFDEIESLVGKRSSKGSHSPVQERILATLLNEMDGVGVRLDKKMDVNLGREKEEHQAHRDNSEIAQDEVRKLKAVDQSQVIVVGATNRPDMVDAALMRPGRLDKLIYVPPPDLGARHNILEVFTQRMKTADINLEELSHNTENYSGADLKNLCKEAGLIALREKFAQDSSVPSSPVILDGHFQKALSTVRPSLTSDVLNLYNK